MDTKLISKAAEVLNRRSHQRRFLRQLDEAICRGDINGVVQLVATDTVDKHVNNSNVLQTAVAHGGNEAAEMCHCLIMAGADVNLTDPATGDTPLHTAVRLRRYDIVKVFIDSGVDMEISDANGSSALSVAAAVGANDAAMALINAGCRINRGDSSLASPLIVCARYGNVDVVQCIVASPDVDLDWVDNERRTALIVAAQLGHEQIADILITAGCSVNAADQYGGTALYFAAKNGHGGLVDLLVHAGADLNKPDTKGCTPFTMAVENLHMHVIKSLLKAKCDVNTADHENKWTALHNAVRLSSKVFGQRDVHLSLVQLLLDADCNINVSDKEGWTPLYQAACNGETDIVRLLLEKGVDVTRQTNTLDTPLHGAVIGNQPVITDMLIKAGCQVNKVNILNKLPLFVAVENRAENKIVHLLLEAGSQTDVCESKSKQSPLYVAVHQEYVEAVELLINAGCDVNLATRDGDTPLWLACSLGNDKIVEILLRHPNIDVDQGISRLPIHAAAVFGSYTTMELLIKAGCNVNKLSDIGVSALFLAAEMNHLPVAQLLVRQGASPSAVHHVKPPSRCCRFYKDRHPHLELEPLFAAVQNDNMAMIRLILVATPRMPYRALVDLRDIVFRTHYVHDARLSERTVKQFAHFFVGILSRPRSLGDECRGVIRDSLCFSGRHGLLVDAVSYLPLPDRLKDYILLRNEPIVGFSDSYM